MTRVGYTQAAFKEGDLDNNGALSADEVSFALKKLKVGIRVQGLGFSLVWEMSFALEDMESWYLNPEPKYGIRVQGIGLGFCLGFNLVWRS